MRQSIIAVAAVTMASAAWAQDATNPSFGGVPGPSDLSPVVPNLGEIPGAAGFAPAAPKAPLAKRATSNLTLRATLTDEGAEVTRGLTWRVFSPEPGPDGKLPMIASSQGGTATFELTPGSYLVHAAFGRAGVTKRITVGREPSKDTVVLDAGGLKLGAVLADGKTIKSDKLRFSIYEANPDSSGDRPLITRDVKPNTVVRLNAGQYHIVSTYGNVNAVVRSDIKIDAGKLTETAVEHNAAEVTLKLVRERGGEALADTSWSILTESGDPITEKVGPYAQLVLADGVYTIVARNRDHLYQSGLTVEGGKNEEIEVIANESTEVDTSGSAPTD